MKKFFTTILMTMLLCATFITSQTSAIVGFDPNKFEKIASQTKKEDYLPYQGPLNDALNELKEKIRRGEMVLDGTETEKKVSAFIKNISEEDKFKYKYMNYATTLTLIPKITDMLSKEEVQNCFNEIKNAHLQLIDNDPNFSPKFKAAIKGKMDKFYLFVPGITHTADDIADFRMDELKLNDKGELENLKEWNDSHVSCSMISLYLDGYRSDEETTLDAFLYVENPALMGHSDHPDYNNAIKKFEELKKNGTLEDYINTKIGPKINDIYMMDHITEFRTLFDDRAYMNKNSNFIYLTPTSIICNRSKTSDDSDIKNSILTTLGHETTHFILSHFNANNKSLLNNSFYTKILLVGDKETYKEFCDKYGHEYHEGDELNPELVKSLRKIDLETTYKRLIHAYENKTAETTESDQKYIEDLYENFSRFVENIDTGMIFSDDYCDSLKGKPVKMSGEVYFGECMADVFGAKAAMIAADKLKIIQTPDNNVYTNFTLNLVKDGNPSLLNTHPIYPYRFRWMYKLSQVDPDMFGFRDRLAGI